MNKEEKDIVSEYNFFVKTLDSEDFKGNYNSKNKKIGYWIEEHVDTHDWVRPNKKETLGYKLFSNGHYKEDVKEGEWKEQIYGKYFNNKTGIDFDYILRRKGEYLNGLKTGKWKYFFIFGGCHYFNSWEYPEQYGFGYYDKGRKVNIWERRWFREFSWIPNQIHDRLGKTLEKIDYSNDTYELGFSLLKWDGIKIILPREIDPSEWSPPFGFK
jgi:hypothetical protein|tara:strand:+ start:103 stop:741 length:639 start_codon:yes stop_codon:yes gene_type:complete